MPKKAGTSVKKLQPQQQRAYIPYTAMTLDANYCVCTYGDAASSLFGYPEVSMLGKPVTHILPALAQKIQPNPAQPPVHIQLSEVRMEARHADGNTFPVMVGLRHDHRHGASRHLILIRNLEQRPQS